MQYLSCYIFESGSIIVYTLLHTTIIKKQTKKSWHLRVHTHSHSSVFPLFSAPIDCALRHVGFLTHVSHSPAHHQRYVCDEAGNGVHRHGERVTSCRERHTSWPQRLRPVLCGSAGGCRKPQAPRRPLRSTFGRRWVASSVNM